MTVARSKEYSYDVCMESTNNFEWDEHLLHEKNALLDSVGEGVCGVDRQGRCLFMNRYAMNILGYTSEEILGKDMHTVTHHHYADGTNYPTKDCPLLRWTTQEHPIQCDQEIIWKQDGTALPVEYTANPLIIEGTRRGTVISFRNNTQRMERDQQMDDFLSIASHELKTPITTIKAFIQLLEKYYATDKTTQAAVYLSRVDAHITRLTNLLQDLIDVSKIQAGRLRYTNEIFDLNALMKETIEAFQMTTPDRTITYKGKPSQYFEGDKHRISQVVTNLVSNASTYSPKDRAVEVTLTPHKNDFVISVKDYGVGFPEDHIPTVFNRFYRASDKTRANFPGLGIGLYVSSEIIKHHQGTIQIKSSRDTGATVSFTLPKHKTT